MTHSNELYRLDLKSHCIGMLNPEPANTAQFYSQWVAYDFVSLNHSGQSLSARGNFHTLLLHCVTVSALEHSELSYTALRQEIHVNQITCTAIITSPSQLQSQHKMHQPTCPAWASVTNPTRGIH